MKIGKSAAAAKARIGIFFAVIGIIILIFGTSAVEEANAFAERANETTAEVIEVNTYKTRDSRKREAIRYTTYVEYTVEGQKYVSDISSLSRYGSVGEQVLIYYDPLNPSEIKTKLNTADVTFIVVFGLSFSGIGAAIALVPTIKAHKKRKLKETGEMATGIITSVVIDRSVRINRRSPYKAHCEVIDPHTDEKYLYSSEGVMEDIRYLQGMQVTVYYDPADRSRYFVDLDSAAENAGCVHDFG